MHDKNTRSVKGKAPLSSYVALTVFLATIFTVIPCEVPNAEHSSSAPSGAAYDVAAASFANSVSGTPKLSPKETYPLRKSILALDRGDVLVELLLTAGISAREAFAASEAVATIYDPRGLRVGQELSLYVRESSNSDGSLCLERLEFASGTDRLVSVAHLAHDTFVANKVTTRHTKALTINTGTIRSSLYDSAQSVDVPATILNETYRALSYAIDFQRDLRAGDKFAVAFEIYDDNGLEQGQHPGNLVYATLEQAQRSIRIFRYAASDGYVGLFDERGMSIESSLMRTPVDGGRLTSLFGKRRHPILGYTRLHRGLDFSAPRGTAVFAAGDGKVVRRGRNGSFGKYVRIEHDSTYATAYAHLSRFAEGLQPGDWVRQGQVIGYVGATGLATGPNLHYEVLLQGKQVNLMGLDLPPRLILSGKELVRFKQVKAELLSDLARGVLGHGRRWAAIASTCRGKSCPSDAGNVPEGPEPHLPSIQK